MKFRTSKKIYIYVLLHQIDFLKTFMQLSLFTFFEQNKNVKHFPLNTCSIKITLNKHLIAYISIHLF